MIGPAELSLATSEIAVNRATRPDAREFAGFELTEAIAVTTVLKQLGTAVPPMDSKSQAILENIKSASNGAQFDRAYIDAQYENHAFLRDLATAYLSNSNSATTDMAELQGRHLAKLALAVFKEHTMITQSRHPPPPAARNPHVLRRHGQAAAERLKEGEMVDVEAFRALVRAAVALNAAKGER